LGKDSPARNEAAVRPLSASGRGGGLASPTRCPPRPCARASGAAAPPWRGRVSSLFTRSAETLIRSARRSTRQGAHQATVSHLAIPAVPRSGTLRSFGLHEIGGHGHRVGRSHFGKCSCAFVVVHRRAGERVVSSSEPASGLHCLPCWRSSTSSVRDPSSTSRAHHSSICSPSFPIVFQEGVPAEGVPKIPSRFISPLGSLASARALSCRRGIPLVVHPIPAARVSSHGSARATWLRATSNVRPVDTAKTTIREMGPAPGRYLNFQRAFRNEHKQCFWDSRPPT
jgi:hypothetical protein